MDYQYNWNNSCKSKYDCTPYQLFGICYNCEAKSDNEDTE